MGFVKAMRRHPGGHEDLIPALPSLLQDDTSEM